MKVVKKPVVVDAWQLDSKRGWIIRPDWVLASMEGEDAPLYFDEVEQRWYVDTLEGLMGASDGDYLIKGIRGELYPCKKDIFEESYEIVEDHGTDVVAKEKCVDACEV